MLIELILLVIMPTSLMGALCSLFGQFGDKIEGLNEHLAAKFVGEQGRGFVEGVPFIYGPLPQILHHQIGVQGPQN